jgi:GH15 family glucan-1,4-alpha-glucosidase
VTLGSDGRGADGYAPISDYGAIGNLRTVALVARDGSIDWCCLPHLDRPSVFGALLDSRRGGCFKVGPLGGGLGEQSYLGDTNILRTVFKSGAGELGVTDFMPLEGGITGCGGSRAEPEIRRVLECRGAALTVEVEWSPRFDYARSGARMEHTDGVLLASGGGAAMSLAGLPESALIDVVDDGFGHVLRARAMLEPGQTLALAARWTGWERGTGVDSSPADLERTRDIWLDWADGEGDLNQRAWAGEWQGLVNRSALAFKLLTHADTGAIAAAATTSLPEEIGGVRNWDYRFAWLRDASLTAQALVSIGHEAEAVDMLEWLERSAEGCCREKNLDMQVLFGLHGRQELPETVLEHLEGYRGSRPVRIGNAAAEQFQLETYGEVLNAGYEIVRRGLELSPDLKAFLPAVADHVCRVWERPDQGIWEMRGEPRHFTYSKVMAWVALDRAVLLAEHNQVPGKLETWRATRERIRRQVLEHGYNSRLGAFVQSYGSEDLDAANLRLPMMEFLPFDDPRMIGTVDRTLEQLTDNGLVYRYLNDDGLPGKEGAFGLCTFWLVDCLAMSGRVEQAGEMLRGIARRANHVGLFPEQFDPAGGGFLGNFPQAFTHIGLVNSVIYMAFAQGLDVPEHAPMGSPAHRDAREPGSGDREEGS